MLYYESVVAKLNQKEFVKFHNKVIQMTLKFTNHMIEQGIRKESWTLTNNFVVSFRDLKRKARTNND